MGLWLLASLQDKEESEQKDERTCVGESLIPLVCKGHHPSSDVGKKRDDSGSHQFAGITVVLVAHPAPTCGLPHKIGTKLTHQLYLFQMGTAIGRK